MAKNNRTPPISSTQEIPTIVERVALYARVSTRDQNCELQLHELRQYCERRGWHIVGEYRLRQ